MARIVTSNTNMYQYDLRPSKDITAISEKRREFCPLEHHNNITTIMFSQ